MLPVLAVALLGLALSVREAAAQPLAPLEECTVVDQSPNARPEGGLEEFSVRRDPDGTIIAVYGRWRGMVFTRDFVRIRAGLSYRFLAVPMAGGLTLFGFDLATVEENRHVRLDTWTTGTLALGQPRSDIPHRWLLLRC